MRRDTLIEVLAMQAEIGSIIKRKKKKLRENAIGRMCVRMYMYVCVCVRVCVRACINKIHNTLYLLVFHRKN